MSTPRTLPYPNTRIGFFVMYRCKSSRTPCPSGITCVAQVQVNQSVTIKILRDNPEAVGQISPVNVCTLRGTRATQAANIQSNPAFGVIECTI